MAINFPNSPSANDTFEVSDIEYLYDGAKWVTNNSVVPVGDGTLTVSGGSGLTGSGTFDANQDTNETITIDHDDTSSQISVDNSGGTVIQDVTLDGFGHITNLNSANLDGRYLQSYTETDTLDSVTDRGNSTTNNITTTGTVSANDFNSTSDIRKKKNVETLTDSLDKVQSLRGVSFTHNDTDVDSIGVIAQEIEEVIPDVVSTNSDGFKSVSYGNIVGLLIEAIKEQQNEINELKAKVYK